MVIECAVAYGCPSRFFPPGPRNLFFFALLFFRFLTGRTTTKPTNAQKFSLEGLVEEACSKRKFVCKAARWP